MDAIRGDFIIMTKPYHTEYVRFDKEYKLFIFDGLRLLDLENDGIHNTKNDLLPKEFKVIENNIPINYWYNKQLNKWCIFYIYSVWFDHSSVKDQYLNNIKYGPSLDNSEQYSLYTNFKYNEDNYYIFCNYFCYDGHESGEHINTLTYDIENEDTKELIINKFREILNGDNINFNTNELFKSIENALVIGL